MPGFPHNFQPFFPVIFATSSSADLISLYSWVLFHCSWHLPLSLKGNYTHAHTHPTFKAQQKSLSSLPESQHHPSRALHFEVYTSRFFSMQVCFSVWIYVILKNWDYTTLNILKWPNNNPWFGSTKIYLLKPLLLDRFYI